MVQLIVGNKGKGKTKHLLEKVNQEIKNTSGNVVYLDKNTKNMYELNNKVRLINVPDYSIQSTDEFVGFVAGIIAADHDLEQLYIDCFLIIACVEPSTDYESIIQKLDTISNTFGIQIILSMSKDESELSENLKSKIIVSL